MQNLLNSYQKNKTVYRSGAFVLTGNQNTPTTINEETRSVAVVAATENGVKWVDSMTGRSVNEYLLMSGAKFPASGQVPMLDEHGLNPSKRGTQSLLGSARNLKVENNQLHSVLYFSKRAANEWEDVKDGHLTDVSIGYNVNHDKTIMVMPGETKTIQGRSFLGPAIVNQEFTVHEVSLTPIGKDTGAKMRSDTNKTINMEDKNMDKHTRDFLIKLGMDAKATDEQALEFQRSFDLEKLKTTSEIDPEAVEKAKMEGAQIEFQRSQEIKSLCDIYKVDDDIKTRALDPAVTVEGARKMIDEFMSTSRQPTGIKHAAPPASIVADGVDKMRSATQDALYMRCGVALGDSYKIDAGAQELRSYSIKGVMREYLKVMNKYERNMSDDQLVKRAMTITDLPVLLGNVANKSLETAYKEKEETWRTWCPTGSVSDFNTRTSVRLSEVGELAQIPNNVGPIKYTDMGETTETYSVDTFAEILPITRPMLINDDLGGLTRLTAKMARAARRLVGNLVYNTLFANAAMGDGTALFHADHNNLAAGGNLGPVGIATMDYATKQMMLQKGVKNREVLDIMPTFILSPVTQMNATRSFFLSSRFADQAAVGTPDEASATTRVNVFSGGQYTEIYEPRLDVNSTTAWYMVGDDPALTVYFLNGQETPQVDTQEGWSHLGIEYRVLLDVGVGVDDWRTISKNPGA